MNERKGEVLYPLNNRERKKTIMLQGQGIDPNHDVIASHTLFIVAFPWPCSNEKSNDMHYARCALYR